MYKKSIRSSRIASDIKRILVELFFRKVSDVRLSGLTITCVDVSPDLRDAKVYYTMSSEQKISEDLSPVLIKLAHFLRQEVSKKASLKYVPKLHFIYDEALNRAMNIDCLIAEISPAPLAVENPEAG
jgi:ribosome-binding factor A